MALILSPLHKKFIKTFPEKTNNLNAAFTAFKNNGDIEPLHSLVHKIVGSGGIYGFMDISQKAQDILQLIRSGNSDTTTLQLLVAKLCEEITTQYDKHKLAL